MENKESVGDNWELALCPLRNKQCLQQQCAWWLKDNKECAITKIASSA
jgi:hypothetical protein